MNKDELWEKFKGMVYSIAHKYRNYAEFDDLVQEGYLGLSYASDTYDDSKGTKFSTHAYNNIRYSILNYLNSYKLVNISRYDRNNIRKVEREMEQGLTLEQACKKLDLNVDSIIFVMTRLRTQVRDEDIHGMSIVDTSKDDNETPHDLYVRETKERHLEELMDTVLNYTQKLAVKLKHGFYEGKEYTFKEIGEDMGMSTMSAYNNYMAGMEILKEYEGEIISIWEN